MTDKFVVSTNEIGRIIVTDVETGKVYDNIYKFFGLIRLLNEQQSTINKQDEEIKKLKRTERSWRKIHCCNKESDNCGIVSNQESKIKLLEKENNDLRQQRDYYEKICQKEGLI